MSSRVERQAVPQDQAEDSAIVLHDDRLLVVNWETDDADVVSFFRNKPVEDRTRAFDRAVKVGVVASNIVGTAEKIDYVQKEFGALEGRFNVALNHTLRELERKFNEAFGEEGTFAQAVQDTFGEKGQVVKQIFDPAREGTPLYQLRVELTRQLADLRTALVADKARLEAEQNTPRGGRRFQEEVGNMLGEIARQRKGDVLEIMTETPGRISRSKKGDFVIRIAEKPDLPIVVEAKDEDISFPAIGRELTEAMENRGAVYSVLVARDVSKLPTPVGWFNEYDGDKLVCAVGDLQQMRRELLSVALAWARIRVLQRQEQAHVDFVQVTEAVVKARAAVARLQAVLTQCTNLETVATKIRDLCREVARELTNQLDSIAESVSADKPRA